jgi:hypothetical protein
MQIPFQLKNEIVYLTADESNYTLARQCDRTRDGVTNSELVAFKWFASIGAALSKIIEMKVKASDAKSLLDLKQVIEAARAEIMAAWSTEIKEAKK